MEQNWTSKFVWTVWSVWSRNFHCSNRRLESVKLKLSSKPLRLGGVKARNLHHPTKGWLVATKISVYNLFHYNTIRCKSRQSAWFLDIISIFIDMFSIWKVGGTFLPHKTHLIPLKWRLSLGRQLSQLQSVSGVTVKCHGMDEKMIQNAVEWHHS